MASVATVVEPKPCAGRWENLRNYLADFSAASAGALKRGLWPVAGCDEGGQGVGWPGGMLLLRWSTLHAKKVLRGFDYFETADAGAGRRALDERICARVQVRRAANGAAVADSTG